jgi:DNA-directed RNA polymerase specialized sigma24 family protein
MDDGVADGSVLNEADAGPLKSCAAECLTRHRVQYNGRSSRLGSYHHPASQRAKLSKEFLASFTPELIYSCGGYGIAFATVLRIFMSAPDDNSVTQWLQDLRTPNRDDASRLLWERYFSRLAGIAQARLRAAASGPADGEDVAVSVFDSFFRGVAEGRFPELGNRDDLWRLLVTITARKAENQRRDQSRQKRGSGRVVSGAGLDDQSSPGDNWLAQVVSNEPTPEFAAMVTDEYRRLFGSLADESHRVVALLKLEGHSNEEVAKILDCSLRTVERKLEVIRKRWLAEVPK